MNRVLTIIFWYTQSRRNFTPEGVKYSQCIFCRSLCEYCDFCKMNTRLRHQARRLPIMHVKLLEIRALWRRARWANREEYLRLSNYIGLDIYFNSLWQFCIPTAGLSACGVSVFFGRAFLYKLKWTDLLTLGRNEHQISLADRVRGMRCIIVPNFAKICQSVAVISQFFDFSRLWLPPSWIFLNS